MKSYWRIIGLVALGATVAYYPALRLYQYLKAKGAEAAEGLEEDAHVVKHLFNHKHKGHRAAANGQLS